MRSTIDVLKAQHRDLGALVAQINNHASTGDRALLANAVRRLKRELLAHLELEDSHLYPELVRAASDSRLPVPMEVANTYRRSMEAVSTALKAFFERYNASFELEDFQRDWPLVAQMLADRIESEETRLYPLYDSWCSRTDKPSG